MRIVLLVCALCLVACPPSRDTPGTPAGTPSSDDFGACEPEAVIESSCSLVESEPVELPGWCQFAQGTPSVFRQADEWAEFLSRCDTDLLDPVADMDWSEFDVVGTVVWASGCSGSHGTLWLADCGEEHHLGYWSNGCGDCDAAWVTTHFLKVPAGRVGELRLQSCVPADEQCPDGEGR